MKIQLFAVFFVVACTSHVFAEIVPFQPPATGLTALPYGDIQPGVEARDLFSRWGVWVNGVDSIPTVRALPFPLGNVGGYLVNEPISGSSAGKPMIIDSLHPLRRIAFRLRTDQADAEATIRVLDTTGTLLDTVLVYLSRSPDTFVGLESTEGGISKVVIDYGAFDEPEKLGPIMVEFTSQMQFVRFLPHIGNGQAPSGDSLSTVIGLIGLTADVAQQGSVYFVDSSGNPLSLTFDDGFTGSSREFNIDGHGLDRNAALTWTTVAAEADLVAGYARIESDGPVEATAILKTSDAGGGLIGQAGIAADRARNLSKILALGAPSTSGTPGLPLVAQAPVNTGVAISNVSDEETIVELRLNYDSQAGGSGSLNKSISLPPGAYVAKFVTEYFPGLGNASFTGTLRVESVQPVAVTALQTSDGVAVSSLPGAGIQP